MDLQNSVTPEFRRQASRMRVKVERALDAAPAAR